MDNKSLHELLNFWEEDEWPDYIECFHKGDRNNFRKYFPVVENNPNHFERMKKYYEERIDKLHVVPGRENGK